MKPKFWGSKLYMVFAHDGAPSLSFLFLQLADYQLFISFTFVLSESIYV